MQSNGSRRTRENSQGEQASTLEEEEEDDGGGGGGEGGEREVWFRVFLLWGVSPPVSHQLERPLSLALGGCAVGFCLSL